MKFAAMHIDTYALDGPETQGGLYPRATRKPTPRTAPRLRCTPWGLSLIEHEKAKRYFLAAPVPPTLRGRR